MKSMPADKIVEVLPDDLQDLIVREAFVRRHREEVAAALAGKRQEQAGFSQTRPSFLAFRKGAKESFASAEHKLRDEIARLERAGANCELILEKCDRAIQAQVQEFLEAQAPSFRQATAAEKLLPEWEQAIGLYRGALKQFITALGIARNQMASGYDRKAGRFATGALEAFDAAIAAARRVEAESATANQIANRHRESLGEEAGMIATLPLVPNQGLAREVAALKAGPLEAAAGQIGTMLEESEKMHADGVPALLEDMARVRAGHEASRKRNVLGPLVEIRAMADGAVDPARMDEVIAAMEARFVTLTG
jgi:hypothetical protein